MFGVRGGEGNVSAWGVRDVGKQRGSGGAWGPVVEDGRVGRVSGWDALELLGKVGAMVGSGTPWWKREKKGCGGSVGAAMVGCGVVLAAKWASGQWVGVNGGRVAEPWWRNGAGRVVGAGCGRGRGVVVNVGRVVR